MEISQETLSAKKTKIVEDAILNELIGFEAIYDKPAETLTLCFKPSSSYNHEKKSKLLYEKVAPLREAYIPSKKEKEEIPVDFTKETRQRYTNTSSFPQSAHGVIIVKKLDEATARWGSGIMISPDIVLTAAHNVYDDQKPIRNRYPDIKFIPGASGDEAPFGEIEIEDVLVPESYIHREGETAENEVNSDDYAFLMLKEPIGRKAGYFGLHAVAAKCMKIDSTKDVFVVGYPEQSNKEETGKFEQWGEKVKLEALGNKNDRVHFQISKYGAGLTGSGMFYKGDDGKYYVFGVYAFGNGDSNSACVITKERYEQLISWIKERKRKTFEEIIQSKDAKDYIKRLDLEEKCLGPMGIKVLLGYNLNYLEEINLDRTSIDHLEIEELSNNSKWENLQKLILSYNNIGDKGCQSLTSWGSLLKLEELDLNSTKIGEQGAITIANSATWKNLKTLNLARNKIGDEGAIAIGNNTTWTNLEFLSLSKTQIGGKGAAAIASNTVWKNVKEIELGSNSFGDDGAVAIGNNTTWTNLERLSLSQNKIGEKGANAIASNAVWKNLKEIELTLNSIGDEGATAIGRNTVWRSLEKLHLTQNKIGDEGAIAIASNTIWNNLTGLDLEYNQIGDEGAVAIGSNKIWTNLEYLVLAHNNIGDKGAISIASNPAWNDLSKLYLEWNQIGDEGGVAIGRNLRWTKLHTLTLSYNQLGWKTIIAIGRGSIWKAIRPIKFTNNRTLTQERMNALRTILPATIYRFVDELPV